MMKGLFKLVWLIVVLSHIETMVVQQSMECISDNWISVRCFLPDGAAALQAKCGNVSLNFNHQRMNLSQMDEGKDALVFFGSRSHTFSLRCKPKVHATLQTQKCSPENFSVDNYNSVVPGRPKIESVQPNATWTRIEFSRAEEMYCFGRRPPFTLLTEILLFDSNDDNVQNVTFSSTQSILDAKILHDLVPFTNYSLSLRQRPMQKYLWSQATFSSFTTAMTFPSRPRVHPCAFEVKHEDGKSKRVTLHFAKHSKVEEHGENFAYFLSDHFVKEMDNNVKAAGLRSSTKASYTWMTRENHVDFFVWAGNAVGFSEASDVISVDLSSEEEEGLMTTAVERVVAFTTGLDKYSVVMELKRWDFEPVVFYCSSELFICKDGVSWIENASTTVNGSSKYLTVDFFTQEPINTIGLAGILKAGRKKFGISWLTCQLISENVPLQPQAQLTQVKNSSSIQIQLDFKACPHNSRHLGLLIRRTTIRYCFIEDGFFARTKKNCQVQMEMGPSQPSYLLDNLNPGGKYLLEIIIDTILGGDQSESTMANFTLVPTLPVVVSRLNYSVVSDGDQVEAIYDQGQLSLRRLQQNPFYPIEDVTLEADYSGYRLTQPLKKTPPAAAVLSSTAIKFPIKVDNDKNKCRERYMTMRFCNEAGCSPWSSKITVHHRPSINDRFQMTLVESPPDSVQVYWEMDLDPSFSVYQFDLNVFNTTSQENTLFENIKVLDSGSQENTTQNTINCQRRHFNETLFLPLCSSERELEHIYDISIRASKITRHGTRLEGPWMITLQTSFMCKSPQDALNVPGVLIVSLGSFLSVAVFLAVMYYLFCKAYRIAHLFGEMENEVEETMKWTNSSSSPLILQRP